MTAAPAGLRSYQDKDRSSRFNSSLAQAPSAHKTNPTLQRLRTKLENGHISATERKILHTLETQSAAQAQAAAKAKAAINRATQADSMPLSSAQAKARFKCRAHAAEVAAAKAQTQYFPEGPQADDEAGNDATQGAAPSFKKRRIDGGSCDSSRNFWDCFFRQTKCNVKKRQDHNIQGTRHQQHPCGSSDEEEEDDEQRSFGNWDSDSAFDFGSDDCDDDEEEEDNSTGDQQQQHPQQFYKQAAPLLGPAEAFQQLVHFVQGLPTKVKDHRSAAHLKGFASKKVASKADLASAARRIWLAVHPDKNNSPAAQEAARCFNNLLDLFKKKGAL